MIQRSMVAVMALVIGSLPMVARAQPITFMARLSGPESVARNSTPEATRTGTGIGMVTFDPDTGDFQFMISFQGLIAQDITTGAPGQNSDTTSGNNFNGAGLLFAHIHVGSREANGPIPVNFVANDMMDGMRGVAPGVMVMPNPIQMATSGAVMGKLNVKQLAARNMGMLLAGVPVNGPGQTASDPQCLRCGFVEAIMSNNTYLNLHTFNNPFGEIRGQLIRVDSGAPAPTR